jgi:hypothetical protein
MALSDSDDPSQFPPAVSTLMEIEYYIMIVALTFIITWLFIKLKFSWDRSGQTILILIWLIQALRVPQYLLEN